MNDTEYDNLLEKLKQMEVSTGIVMANSPTRNVGTSAIDSIPEIEHSHLMLSLDKVHSIEEIKKFAGNNKTVAMMKMDGLTISVEYTDGNLNRIETRGNGYRGNDVTHLCTAFINLPAKIDKPGKYVIDGEAIITYEDFDRINSKFSNPDDRYKNPRNLAAGSLNLLDTNVAKERHLKFIAWDVIEGDDSNNFIDRLYSAQDLGFSIVPLYQVSNNYEEVIQTLRETARKLSYPIDGIVIKMVDIAYGKSLGKTDKFFRNAVAYKFEDDKYPTKLQDVVWQVGKTGIITPVIITDPVDIDGSTVNRASVHNISIFKQLHLTHGCTCYMYKANQIIPQCDSTEDDGDEEFQIPNKCPICGGSTQIAKENDSEILICTNPGCGGKLLGKLRHFVSKDAVNIDGMSEATLKFLINKSWLSQPKDVYYLSQYKNKWKKSAGFGERSVQKLLDNIEKSRKINFSNFLYSLSIPLIGKSASKEIAKACDYDIDQFRTIVSLDGNQAFMDINGFGEEMNKSLLSWWNRYHYEFCDLAKEFTFIKKNECSSSANSAALNNVTIVITGSLYKFKNRNELVKVIESHGGKVAGSVTSKTNYLLNNDINSNSSKNKKAKELGVPIITEEEFLKMI